METITINQKSFRNQNGQTGVSRNNRRRRNRARVQVVMPTQPVVVGRNGKTARNRRRRLRKRVVARGVNALTSGNQYFGRYFSGPYDPTMVSSVHKLVQTQFYPQKGVYRGISNGLEMTGITFYQGSLEISVNGTTLNTLSFEFIPGLYAKGAAGTQANFFNSIAATAITDPKTTPLAGAVGGPFATTNPSTTGRVVSAALIITPASTVLNRGGEGKLGYASSSDSLNWTRSDIDNLAISRSWDGLDAMALHWTPGVAEYEFGQATVYNPDMSSLVGYVVAPVNVAMAWRVEWQVGIEYLPNSTFRPLIDRKAPKVRPDARYFLNDTIQEHWTPLMISTLHNYQERLAIASSLGGLPSTQFINHAGVGGTGFVGMNAGEQAGVLDEFEEDNGFVRVMGAAQRSAGQHICNFAEGLTGEDVCGNPMGALGNMVGNAFGRPQPRPVLRNRYALGL